MRGKSNEYSERFQRLLDNIPSEGAERLVRSIDRTNSGVAEDLTTPLCTPKTRQSVLKSFEEAVGYTEFEDYTEIDLHEKDKVGPMSIMLPADERMANLKKYWSQHFNPDEAALSYAYSKVVSVLPKRSLRLAGLELAYGLMPKDTNLGLPWLSRDRRYATSYLHRAERASSPSDWYPCNWYWRGQAAGEAGPPKQRDVWGFDHLDTILCATILNPLLGALRLRPGFSAWLGSSYVDEEMTRILRKLAGRRILAGDYTGFDSSLPRQLMDLVDDVWCEWFVESAHPRIRLVGEVCATIGIAVPYDVLTDRNGGMPSGHGLTNMKDTIANLLAIHYGAYRMNTEVEDYAILGDDFVVLFRDDWDPKAFSDAVAELGLEANPDKQFISTDAIHYLQKWHSLRYEKDGICVGCHSPYRSAASMLSYERWRNPDVWSGEMDVVRWIMQLEVFAEDPRHARVCGWLVPRDKYLSHGVDPATIFRRAGGPEKARSVLSIASFPFNVKNPDKFHEFKTVRTIRALQDGAMVSQLE